MPTARINDCDLYFEVSGNGPNLVFIHGEDHDLHLFDHQVAHFSKRYNCIGYERRGHGRSELTPYGYSLHNQTLDLIGLLDHLDVDHMVIIAVAMATPIATSFALAHPDRVRGLVLASWYELDGYPSMENRRRGKHPTTFGKFHMLEYQTMRDLGSQGLLDLLKREGDALLPILPVEPEVREQVMRMIASHPPEHFIKAAEYYTSMPNLVPQLAQLKCPILGICGSDDPSPDNPELLGGAARFEQTWIPGARRFSMMESPAGFNAALERFLTAIV